MLARQCAGRLLHSATLCVYRHDCALRTTTTVLCWPSTHRTKNYNAYPQSARTPASGTCGNSQQLWLRVCVGLLIDEFSAVHQTWDCHAQAAAIDVIITLIPWASPVCTTKFV